MPTATDTLPRLFAERNIRRASERIVLYYEEHVSPDPRLSVADWYGDERARILAMASRLGASAWDLESALAVLSPEAPWERCRDAFLRDVEASGGMSVEERGRPWYPANGARANRILVGEPIELVTQGPKVRAFASNLAGYYVPVTVDRHSSRLVGWPVTTRRAYQAAEIAFRCAAGELGIPPAMVQARTWVAWRGAEEKP